MIAVPRVLTAAGLLTLSLNTASSPQPPFGGGADVARQVGQRFERTAPKVGELMPNLQIYDADGKAIWLHDVLKGHPSVLILGCLTFLGKVSRVETLERDYTPKGVRFFYVYKALAHPEHNRYVAPVTLEERLMHVKEAQRTLGSRVEWLCDTMSNDLSAALGGVPNAELLLDSEARVAARRGWSDPDELRGDLERLVGRVKPPTQVADLDMKTQPPPPTVATGVVPRVEIPSRSMRALVVKARTGESRMPFYAKLRAEADADYFQSGKGQLYLGFHLDPLYRVHWNNEVDPLRFEVEAPPGVTVTPSSGSAPEIAEKADADPREFLVAIEGESAEPMKIEVFYYACDDANTFCVPAKQSYDVTLERDRFGGTVRSRSRPGGGGSPGAAGPGGPRGGRGRMAGDPAERWRMIMERFDADGDGFVTEDEMRAMRGRMGGSGGPRRATGS